MELFDDRVVLFESDEGGEYLLVTLSLIHI